ncbi:MAG: 4Fe-4S dicluster domain-containing protein [Candidatus Omnitrophota bacterium]
METLYIKSERFKDFLQGLARTYQIFLPSSKDQDYFYSPFSSDKGFLFNQYRSVEPLKSFLTYARQNLGRLFADKNYSDRDKPLAIFGVKNCDLTSLRIQDFVFKEGIQTDPVYDTKRQNTLIVSSDCTAYKEVCFCLALDIKPHPESGFDLNLSVLNDGFILEIGSQKGRDTIKNLRHLFIPTTPGQLSGRRLKRENLIEKLKTYLLGLNLAPASSLQKAAKGGYHNLELWTHFMLTCVECGACNFICPACHCFILEDRLRKNNPVRSKVWDSCLYLNYAKVAGGANPLNTRAKRLRNRFMKKFDFFPDNLGTFGCTGCGRCIEACPAKIDIREVLKNLYEGLTVKTQ